MPKKPELTQAITEQRVEHYPGSHETVFCVSQKTKTSRMEFAVQGQAGNMINLLANLMDSAEIRDLFLFAMAAREKHNRENKTQRSFKLPPGLKIPSLPKKAKKGRYEIKDLPPRGKK